MDLRAGVATTIEVPASVSGVGHRRLVYRHDMNRLMVGASMLLASKEDESQHSFWTRCDPESVALEEFTPHPHRRITL